MTGIKILKMAAPIAAAAVLAGCAVPKSKTQVEIQAQYSRKVTLHTKESLQRVGDSERAFC